VAILAADGCDAGSLRLMGDSLLAEGAMPVIVAPRLGPLVDSSGRQHWVEQSLLTGSSVLFDAVYVPGGQGALSLADERDAIDWVCEAFRHCKPIAATGEGAVLLGLCPGILPSDPQAASRKSGNGGTHLPDAGLLVSEAAASEEFVADFVGLLMRHRFWERQRRNRLSASGDRETRGCANLPERGAPPPGVIVR
jgi:catalase